MSIQLLFCVETNQKAKTDTIYINETIAHYYRLGTSVKKSFIYLGGKNNYNKPGIIKQINRQIRQYARNGKTQVIYCIDTDKYDSDPVQRKELDEIASYCRDRGYELIWFCRDVEDVFWGGQIVKDEKVKRAAQFRTSKRINSIPETTLRQGTYTRHYSNILDVLDKYIEKKD